MPTRKTKRKRPAKSGSKKSAARKSRAKKVATAKTAKKKAARKRTARKTLKRTVKKAAKKPAKKPARKAVKKTAAKATSAPKRVVKRRVIPRPSLEAASAPSLIDQITAMAANSAIARYKWLDDSGDRGKAPLSYIKGMAVVYARVYCKLKAGDPAAIDMARRNSGAEVDALTPYAPIFAEHGMSNDSDGVDTLRHLFVLLTGLGVRESSGFHCMGRYMNQDFDSADDAEAGLFQTAYGLRNFCPSILNPMFAHYTANPSGFLEIFSVGITCKPADWKNWGDPSEPGYKFQQLTKTCPAFAAEFAAVGMRHSLRSWGRYGI